MGVENGFVRKAGAWYTYEGDQLGQGKENARNFLKDNPDLADEIEKKIKEKLGVGVRPEEPAAEPGADAAVVTAATGDPAKTVPAPAAAKVTKPKAATAKS
jgi:recombination protein RecA